MMTSGTRIAALSLLVVAGSIGTASLSVFALFLFAGSIPLTHLPLGDTAALGWDALLSLAFFAQHSGMIRKPFRRRLESIVPASYHGALYTIASGIMLLLLVFLWQPSGGTVIELHGAFRWVARGVFVLSLTGMLWGVHALGSFDAFGLEPILAEARGSRPHDMPLAVRGPYRRVRHPLYTFTLLLIWSCPDVTVDRLLFDVAWTIWMVVATVLEERDLVTDFGDAYREYQRTVPMLLPWRIASRR